MRKRKHLWVAVTHEMNPLEIARVERFVGVINGELLLDDKRY